MKIQINTNMQITTNKQPKPPKDPLNRLTYVILVLVTIITIISIICEPSSGNAAREIILLFSFMFGLLLTRILLMR
ncbi:MAG: hypothetical protein FWG64_12915 [Firmicutes bacterium]|nr:hypothetical protein [Bacillota bacterium]